MLIRSWSLFCSIQIYVSLHLLPILSRNKLSKLFVFLCSVFFVCSVFKFDVMWSPKTFNNFCVIAFPLNTKHFAISFLFAFACNAKIFAIATLFLCLRATQNSLQLSCFFFLFPFLFIAFGRTGKSLRLRKTQNTLQLSFFFLSFSFSLVLLDGLAKVILKYLSNWCFEYVTPGSEIIICYAVCFQPRFSRNEQ